ncbi:MAG: hypothetical protein U1C74_02890 [Phenylobacterium sp.]|nr:hypothetical protein [Phenylobacterium sp.]
MDPRIFARVTLAATAAQIGMVVGGHLSGSVPGDLLALGGLGISMLAGVFHARIGGGGWTNSLVGGLLSGAACAFLGLGASVLMGGSPPSLLVLGTAGSAVAGLIGGAAGRLTARRPKS